MHLIEADEVNSQRTPACGVNAQRSKQESPAVDRERATASGIFRIWQREGMASAQSASI